MVSRRIKEMLSELPEISIIDSATDSLEAMTVFETRIPDVVLLDINLPGKSGIEILKEIKLNYLNTSVVMLTNCSEPCMRKLCKELGADFFFDKSSEFEKVPETMSYISSSKTGYSIPMPFPQ